MYRVVAVDEEDRQIRQVLARLVEVYPEVPSDRLRSIVDAIQLRFEYARIRDFVPLLVERRTREHLADPAATGPYLD